MLTSPHELKCGVCGTVFYVSIVEVYEGFCRECFATYNAKLLNNELLHYTWFAKAQDRVVDLDHNIYVDPFSDLSLISDIDWLRKG